MYLSISLTNNINSFKIYLSFCLSSGLYKFILVYCLVCMHWYHVNSMTFTVFWNEHNRLYCSNKSVIFKPTCVTTPLTTLSITTLSPSIILKHHATRTNPTNSFIAFLRMAWPTHTRKSATSGYNVSKFPKSWNYEESLKIN